MAPNLKFTFFDFEMDLIIFLKIWLRKSRVVEISSIAKKIDLHRSIINFRIKNSLESRTFNLS